jgi:hypothetical protein
MRVDSRCREAARETLKCGFRQDSEYRTGTGKSCKARTRSSGKPDTACRSRVGCTRDMNSDARAPSCRAIARIPVSLPYGPHNSPRQRCQTSMSSASGRPRFSGSTRFNAPCVEELQAEGDYLPLPFGMSDWRALLRVLMVREACGRGGGEKTRAQPFSTAPWVTGRARGEGWATGCFLNAPVRMVPLALYAQFSLPVLPEQWRAHRWHARAATAIHGFPDGASGPPDALCIGDRKGEPVGTFDACIQSSAGQR